MTNAERKQVDAILAGLPDQPKRLATPGPTEADRKIIAARKRQMAWTARGWAGPANPKPKTATA